MVKARLSAKEQRTRDFHHIKGQLVDHLGILIKVLRSDMQELREAPDPVALTKVLQPLAETLCDASRSWSALADGMARVKNKKQ